jgi:hypothetical protein
VSTSDSRPLDSKILIAVLFGVGVPVAILVRVFWIHHNWGAFGIGITVGYAVVLAMMWSGRAPREREERKPSVMTAEAWVYFRMIGSTGFLSIVNTEREPLRVPGLVDGAAAGLTLEALQSGESKTTVSLAPRSPPGTLVLDVPPTRYDFVKRGFVPEESPSARTIRFDVAAALADLAPGDYDLRVRWDPTPFAGPGLWTPPTPVILGIFPFRKR